MEHVCAEIFIRDNNGSMPKGAKVEIGTHNFPHATYLVRGSARCLQWRRSENEAWTLIEDVVRSAPTFFPVEAGDRHEFVALENGTIIHCLFVPRDPTTGEIVPEWNGWMEAAN
jgi:quercetin dioxygenase-like cupin family protein